MKLIHFSDQIIQDKSKIVDRGYSIQYTDGKPFGFWVSVEDNQEEGWEHHIRKTSMDKNYERFIKYQHEVKVTGEVAQLQEPDDLEYFNIGFSKPHPNPPTEGDYRLIDWSLVRQYYKGLIVPFYDKTYAKAPEYYWHRQWYCAAGCIWDLRAIKSIKLISEKENKS